MIVWACLDLSNFFIMGIRKFNLLFILGVALGALIGSILYVGSLGEPDNEAVAFATLGLDQTVMATETSSYEIHRAVEHFSYIVLGWTIEPAFAEEVVEALGEGYSVIAQSQEKQSILLTVSASPELLVDEGVAYDVLMLLQKRITEYNSKTHAGYNIAVERYSFVEGERSDWRIVAGMTLLAVVMASLVVILFENTYARSRRS
jgi:hypothetical protein